MTKNQWIQVLICFCLIIIGSALGLYYYQEYIAPESYVIGTINEGTYKDLYISDYLSDDTVIFSKNINNAGFKVEDGVATYDYNFTATEFNGIDNSYVIFVNDYIVSDITSNAGTISGTYNLTYYDTNFEELCSTPITIQFTFRTLTSVLRVSLPATDLGYLMNYFRTDNMIITLSLSPFTFGDKDGEVDEKINQIIILTEDIEIINENLNTISIQADNYAKEISELANAGNNLSENISNLMSSIDSTLSELEIDSNKLSIVNDNIASIENDSYDLLEENEILFDLLNSQKTIVKDLSVKLITLNSKLNYYKEVLSTYEVSNKYIVSFVFKDTVIDIQSVIRGEYAHIPEYNFGELYKFKGWSIDGLNIIDINNFSIVENTSFIAIYEELNSITLLNGDEIIDTLYLADGEKITLSTNPIRDGAEFYGWTINGEDIVDLSNYTVNSNITLRALFGKYEDFDNHSLGSIHKTGGYIDETNIIERVHKDIDCLLVDLSKSTINILFYSHEGVVGSYDNPAYNAYYSNLNLDQKYEFAPRLTGYKVTGSFYLTVSSNGDITFDPNNCQLGYSNGSYMSSTSYNLNFYNCSIYCINY